MIGPLQVQEDILASLKLNNPLRLISSFNRPNITYEVLYQLEQSPPLAAQLSKLIQGMTEPDGITPCCIVYTLKRETADEFVQKLRIQGEALLKGLVHEVALELTDSADRQPTPC